ncbi:hypothetical protein SB780_38960, partial [Burkholderia sp. SIMBA_057]
FSVLFLKETGRKPLNGSLPNVETKEEAQYLVDTQDSNNLLDPAEMALTQDVPSDSEGGRRF